VDSAAYQQSQAMIEQVEKSLVRTWWTNTRVQRLRPTPGVAPDLVEIVGAPQDDPCRPMRRREVAA
jgi:hypothetical protein